MALDYNKIIAKARKKHEEWLEEHPLPTGAEIRAESDEWWREQMERSAGLYADDDEQLLKTLGLTEEIIAKRLGLNPTAMDYFMGRRF